jgi:hypothetical protein
MCWLTGYDEAGRWQQTEQGNDIGTFFAEAPAMHPNSSLITGVVCGMRVEGIKDPLMQEIRSMDKLIDERAKGRASGRPCGGSSLFHREPPRLEVLPGARA